MKSGLRVAFLLLLVTGTVTAKGSDLSEAPNDNDVHREAAAQRPKRFSGLSGFFSRKGATAKPTPAVTEGLRFDLADALHPDPTSSEPTEGHDFGFKLEDALRPAEKPADDSGGYCQRILLEKLKEVLENQKLLLKQRAPSSRFYNGR